MTFKDISYKIFKENSAKYVSYFLSTSFSIMVFFIYSTLVFNRNFIVGLKNSTILPIMGSAMLVVGIFTVFFISYAHTSFIKSRNREFGLFLTLGMTTKDIGKIIRIENGIIGLLSLALGLLSGTIFSRLFFLSVIKILELEGIDFALNLYSYLATFLAFIVIFVIVILLSRKFVKKLEITDLLRESRKARSKKRAYPLVGFIGVLLVILSFFLFFWHLEDKLFPNQNYWMIVFLAINLVGIYFIISEFGSMIMAFFKRNQSLYYSNLLNLSEIHYKYRLNTKIIFITTILSAVVIFFIGLSYSLYSETLTIATEENPYHLAYGFDSTDSKETRDKIQHIINNSSTPVVEEKIIEYLEGTVPIIYNEGNARWELPAISEKTYNLLSNRTLDLKEGEAATLLQIAKPERNQWWTKPEIEYYYGDNSIKLSHTKELTEILMNLSGSMIIIINDTDYDKITKNLQHDFIRKELHLVNFKNWKAIDGLAVEIEQIQFNKIEEKNRQSMMPPKEKPVSRIQVFQELKQQYGFLLFIMSFIGLLFFVTAGNVLYFKLRNDIEDSKKKFDIITKLGIHSKEVKKIISSELRMIFYVPFMIGVIVGYGFIYILTVNISIRDEILVHTSVVVLVYFILQTIFYLLAKRKHISEVIANN